MQTVSVGAALLLFAATARADDGKPTEATVITFEGGAIVLDLAAASGAHPGDDVELWRPVRVRHPITGKMLVDRFRVGSLKLTQVRPALALAEPDGALAEPARPGDVVVFGRPAAVIATPDPHEPIAIERNADPDADAVTALFESLRGRSPDDRAAAYSAFVVAHGTSRFAPFLVEEAVDLREKKAVSMPDHASSSPALASFSAPTHAWVNRPLTLAVEIFAARGAVLHSRKPGELAYQSAAMRPMGGGAFAGTLDASRLTASRLEFFIEAVDVGGVAHAIVGTSSVPQTIAIEDPDHVTPPLAAIASAGLSVDYARFNLAKNNDELTQTEGFVGLRFDDEGLRALRTGFGVYRGKGGSLDDLDRLGKAPRSVGLTYGWLEFEHGLSKDFSFIGRAIVGVGEAGVQGGAQAFVRIGSDRSTNLLIGGEVIGGVGVRGITELDLAVHPRVPIALRTEVTNEPAGAAPDATAAANTATSTGEVGVRAIAQVGFRITPAWTVFARGSYQGRTIDHSGPGAGAAVTYSW